MYTPLSEVVNGENLRVDPLIKIRPSVEATIAEPLTVQVAFATVYVSTDGLRVQLHVRLPSVPANNNP